MSNIHSKQRIGVRGLLFILLVSLTAPLMAQHDLGATPSATEHRIIQYVRARFGIPRSTTLTIAPFRNSKYADFDETTIFVQAGKTKKSQPVLITKDRRYLVIGDILVSSTTVQRNLPAHAAATDKKIVDYVRTKFKIPTEVKLTVGPFRKSQYDDFYRVPILAEDKGKTSSTAAFITKDARYTVIGSIFDLNVNPRKEAEQTISLANQPTIGPATAPVTIVEFADLECPTCAEMHKFIENKLVPKYGNKIRVVFKEIPLVAIHDWALEAAIANQCGYQLDPGAYVRYRSIIFESQGMIHADNVRQLLLDFGQRAGLDKLKLSKCMDSRASLPRVEKDMNEAQKLGVMSTPTLFINGVREIGLYPKRIEAMIDKDLQAAK